MAWVGFGDGADDRAFCTSAAGAQIREPASRSKAAPVTSALLPAVGRSTDLSGQRLANRPDRPWPAP
jgi:hypothetical protein